MYDKNGFNYICVLIDGFSKRVFAHPIQQKTSEMVQKVFEKVFTKEAKIYPDKLETDKVIHAHTFCLFR
jgi:hypothetical protein